MTKHFNEQLAEKEDQLAALQADVRVRHDQLEQRCNAAIVRADKTQSELTAAYEQIDYKNGTIARLEQTLSADTARLEKKLHAQVITNLFRVLFDLSSRHARTDVEQSAY
jgi:septal ring factor EnvC (AmiA/AmiB activator)